MYIPECKHRLYLYKILVYTHSNYQNIKERLCLQNQYNKLQNYIHQATEPYIADN